MFKIGQDQDEIISVSGMQPLSDMVALPKTPLFNCEFPPGHKRPYDAEYKILEKLASRYHNIPNIAGYIDLFSERAPCSSKLDRKRLTGIKKFDFENTLQGFPQKKGKN